MGDYNDLLAFVEGKNDLRYFADSDQIAKEQYIELKLCHLEEIILNRVSGERVRVTENGQEREKKKTSEESGNHTKNRQKHNQRNAKENAKRHTKQRPLCSEEKERQRAPENRLKRG